MKNFFKIILVCSFVIIATELGVRGFAVAPTLPKHFSNNQKHPILPWLPEPNSKEIGWSAKREFKIHHQHNSQGFRDVDHEFTKPANTFRIVALGDSFTYGVGAPFEKTFLSVLEKKLNLEDREQKIEIINLGVPRYWTEPERLVLEHIGAKYKPDYVLLTFIANDVVNTYLGFHGIKVSQGYLISREAERFGEFGMWLYLHSHAARILFSNLSQLTLEDSEAPFYPRGYSNAVMKANDVHEPDWQKVESEFLKISAITEKLGARLGIVYIPEKPAHWGFASYPSERLKKWSREHNADFFDTRLALRSEYKDNNNIYWKYDSHLRPKGYKIVAETIFSQLKDQLIAR